MDSKKRKIIKVVSIVFAAILAVSALTVWIIGVATHEEGGLLRVCVNDGEGLRYIDTGDINIEGAIADRACERVEELRWPSKQIPMSVSVVAGDGTAILPGEIQREAIDASIEHINTQLDFTLLEPSGDSETADVLVRFSVPVGDMERGGTTIRHRALGAVSHHIRADGSYFCELLLFGNIGDLRGEFLVSVHELLHCAGLGHDHNNPSSVMFPYTLNDSLLDQMVNAAMITGHDKAILIDLYDN